MIEEVSPPLIRNPGRRRKQDELQNIEPINIEWWSTPPLYPGKKRLPTVVAWGWILRCATLDSGWQLLRGFCLFTFHFSLCTFHFHPFCRAVVLICVDLCQSVAKSFCLFFSLRPLRGVFPGNRNVRFSGELLREGLPFSGTDQRIVYRSLTTWRNRIKFHLIYSRFANSV